MLAPTVEFWPVAIGAFTHAVDHIVQGSIGLGANHGAAIRHQLDVACEHNLHRLLETATGGLGQGGLP